MGRPKKELIYKTKFCSTRNIPSHLIPSLRKLSHGQFGVLSKWLGFRKRTYVVYAIDPQEKVLGWAAVTDQDHYDVGKVQAAAVYVRSKCRGKGLGEKLSLELINRSRRFYPKKTYHVWDEHFDKWGRILRKAKVRKAKRYMV